MLKILCITLLLLAGAVHAADDDDAQVKEEGPWFYYWTYLPDIVWQRLGTFVYERNKLEFSVNFWSNEEITERVKDQYRRLGHRNDFYTFKCRVNKLTNGK